MPGPVLNRGLGAVFRTERHLVGRVPLPIGLSLYALADRQALLAGLVAGGVLSAADQTSLETLGTETIRRAEELGFGTVQAGTVEQSR